MDKHIDPTDTAMSLFPTGTVTFLFSDMAGSTNLARNFPDTWPEIQARHHELLHTAISAHHGYVFQIIGDEFQAAFATAQDALKAAVAAQHALRMADWGEIGSMHVRMGLHTGPVKLRGDRYEGYLILSYTKRLMSIAHGDQILLSAATETLLPAPLPDGITLRNLGKRRLKDFPSGAFIFQVLAPDLPAEFPPLKTLDAPPSNLPLQLTSFIGRAQELEAVKQILSGERLLTLTGPGGSGKTRLAIQASAELIAQFPDGVFFVPLAHISDPGLVPSTIAQTLGIREFPGWSIRESLKNDLIDKTLLLVLDNFEQVLPAAPSVAALLADCGEVRILVTSREGLHISGEHEFPVPPLTMPNLALAPSADALSHYAAVELFLQRARAVKPDFHITDETAPVVAEICRRLDGLPLSIELAAARIKLLSPRAMLERLEHPLVFLTGGARDLPPRQQTLRSAVAWSYDLLNEQEQQLFRRLAVFAGGCTLEAVASVAQSPTADDTAEDLALFDHLESLIDKSLLQEREGLDNQPRFVMLETLRAFGLERLEASGEQDEIRRRHARFYLGLAEQAEASREREGQVYWMNQMEQEHDNLRAALEWCRNAPDAPAGETEICLRLINALGLFWEARGYYTEGRERLAAILSTQAAEGRNSARANVLARAAELAYRQSDFLATVSFARESLGIYRELGDAQGMASALIKLGNASTEMGSYASASKYLEEALGVCRKRGDHHGTARALISFGWAALRSGDYLLAKARLEEALAISREWKDTRSMGFEYAGLGEVALRQGDYPLAAQLVEESLRLRSQLGNKWGIGVSLGILGWVAMREEDWERALQRLCESLQVRWEIGDLSGSAWCFERLAAVAQAQGHKEKAVRLFGAGAALREKIRSVIDPSDKPAYESKIRLLRGEFGSKQFTAIWHEGRSMSIEQAVRYALER